MIGKVSQAYMAQKLERQRKERERKEQLARAREVWKAKNELERLIMNKRKRHGRARAAS
jgi:hypothetical protein